MNAYHIGNGIVLYRNLIDPETIKSCNVSVIEKTCTPQGFSKKDGKLYTAGGYEYNQETDSVTYPIRFSENIDLVNFTDFLVSRIYDAAVYYCSVFPSVIECITEHKQFHYIKYSKNSVMGPHSDCSASYKDGSVEPISISAIDNTLSTSIVLDSNFTGGEFRFTVLDDELLLNPGDALIYPSNFIGSHEVKKIQSGERWAFLSFFSHARTQFGGKEDIEKRNLWLNKFRSDINIENAKMANSLQNKVKIGKL
jgi:hypothetical protein